MWYVSEYPDPEALIPGHLSTADTSGCSHTQESDANVTETSGGNQTQEPGKIAGDCHLKFDVCC